MLNSILQLSGSLNRPQPTPNQAPLTLHISSLPPDILIRIFTFLPIPCLPIAASVSRRWKVLVYSDEIYDLKLKMLGMADSLISINSSTNPGVSDTISTSTSLSNPTNFSGSGGIGKEEGSESKTRLVARLRQLPGGQFLPTRGKFLHLKKESEDCLGMISTTNTTPNFLSPSSPIHKVSSSQVSSPLGKEKKEDGDGKSHGLISSTLPDIKSSHLIIGSGGLKAALTKSTTTMNQVDGKPKQKKSVLQRMKESKDPKQDQPIRRPISRDMFKKIYTELYPYYIDFKLKSNDSIVFQEYSDLSEIAAVLSRLLLFDTALFLERPDSKSISSNLVSTIQWFESRLLGQFDHAYDQHDIEEMRVNAYASFQLNGGMGCLQVFVSKNPVFFDLTFNPSLLDSKLPSLTGPSMGYALADEFAKYMDHILTNCMTQAALISQVFVPTLQAMTVFLEKVFEDCIQEYLTALITSSKSREDLVVYLHTLASSIYSSTQLINLLAANTYHVEINVEKLRKRVKEMVSGYLPTYLDLELEHLRKRYKLEIEKWDKRGKKGKGKGNGVGSGDEKNKNKGMIGSVKAMVMAPVVLLGGGMKRGQSQPLLTDVADDHMIPETKDTATYDIADQSMNSLISVELAIHLMHSNKESLGRALVITANTDMTKLRNAVQKIFVLLLKVIGEKHLKPAFAIAIDRLSKSEPMDFGEGGNKIIHMDSLQFFDLIQMGDLVQQMIQGYYQEDIRMWIDEQDFLSDIIIEKKAFERLLDDSVAAGMDKAIQVLINQCEFLLISSHSLNDFNPGAQDYVMDVKPTKACRQVMECLEVHTKALKGSIESNTMEVFLAEVSVRLFQIIIKNIRRLQVSQIGAMQLICDFNRYYDWAYSLRLSTSTKMFQALKELGNLFLADGSEELCSLVHDLPRFNGSLRIEEIYELLQSRTDYKEIRTQVEGKEFEPLSFQSSLTLVSKNASELQPSSLLQHQNLTNHQEGNLTNYQDGNLMKKSNQLSLDDLIERKKKKILSRSSTNITASITTTNDTTDGTMNADTTDGTMKNDTMNETMKNDSMNETMDADRNENPNGDTNQIIDHVNNVNSSVKKIIAQKNNYFEENNLDDADILDSETFTSLSISRPVLKAIASLGFVKPTTIQSRAIPIALQGKDICASAITGSGKTAAFMIPILERLLFRPKVVPATRVLILVPTRELGAQCYKVASCLSSFSTIQICLCVGGLSNKIQEAELCKKPDIVIATPGRLIDHIHNSKSFTLDHIEILVMDEADRILEDGFKAELEEIIKHTPIKRQTMLFSATMTDNVDELIKLSLQKPVRLFVDASDSMTTKLVQEFIRIRQHREDSRPAILASLCSRTFTSETLIFFKSKAAAHRMKIFFGLLGLKAAELHGNLTQPQRLESLESFKQRKVDFLLCTDVASRGLDITGIKTVINYEMPTTYQVYIHRCGRTARGDASGRAVSLVGEQDRPILKLALKNSQDAVKHRVIPGQVLQDFTEKMALLQGSVSEIEEEEKEEKAIGIAEMEIRKAQNRIEFEDDILSRPARTWFQTEHEKQKEKEVKIKVVDQDAPKRTKLDGMSRRKKRLYLARQDDKLDSARQNIAAKQAKRETMPGKIGKMGSGDRGGKGKGGNGGNGSGGKKRMRSSGSRFDSDKNSTASQPRFKKFKK